MELRESEDGAVCPHESVEKYPSGAACVECGAILPVDFVPQKPITERDVDLLESPTVKLA
jgi:hypothetical protein